MDLRKKQAAGALSASTAWLVFWLVGLELIIVLISLISMEGYFIEFGDRKSFFLLLEHVRYGAYNVRLIISDSDFGYLLAADPATLRSYFPKFYLLVYVSGLTVRYLLPVVTGFLLLRQWFRFRNQIGDFFSRHLRDLNVLWPFSVTLIVALGLYFSLRGPFSDPFLFQLSVAGLSLVSPGTRLVELLKEILVLALIIR